MVLRSSAREWYLLRTASAVVGDGNVRGSQSRSCGRERDGDGATRACCDAGGTVINLRKVAGVGAGDRNPGNTERPSSFVGQRDDLTGARGAHRLIAKVQTDRYELDVGSSPLQ